MDQHKLATELIKATGQDINDPESYVISHINCSHSSDFDVRDPERSNAQVEDSFVIKAVLIKLGK